MYQVVVFDESNEVESVPLEWIREDQVLWPTVYSREAQKKAIKNRFVPDGNTWRKYKVRLLRNGLCSKLCCLTINNTHLATLCSLTCL